MTDDELTERMSRRFGDRDESDKSSQSEMSSTQSKSDKNDKNAQTSQKTKNVKKEWNVRSFYLDDDLDTTLTTAFKRLDLELSEAGEDVDLKKTRHFYPLVVALGLERLEEMEVTEVTEQLERTESV